MNLFLIFCFISCSSSEFLVLDNLNIDSEQILKFFSSPNQKKMIPLNQNFVKITQNYDEELPVSCIHYMDAKKAFLYRNKIINDQKSISIVGDFPNIAEIFKDLIHHKYKTQIGFSNSSKYVLSLSPFLSSDHNFEIIDDDSEFKFLKLEKRKIKVFIQSRTNSNIMGLICNDFPNYFNIFSACLLCFFCFILMLRISFLGIPFLFNNLSHISIWIVGTNGSLITRPSKMIYPQQMKAIIKMLHEIVKTGKPQNSIIKINCHNPDKTIFERAHLYKMTKSLILIVVWEEKFDNRKKSFTHDITGNSISGDSEELYDVTTKILFDNQNRKYARIDFELDRSPCSLELHPNNYDALAFGMSSLNLHYLHKLHFSIVRDIGHNNINLSLFSEFAREAYTKLDFEVLCVFLHNNNEFKEIIGNYKNQAVKKDILKFVHIISTINSTPKLHLEYIGENRYGGVKFKIASDEYILAIGLKIKNFVLRGPESRFVFIMQLIFSFHHTILSPKLEILILQGFHDIIESTGRMSLIKCTKSLTNINQVYGTIFGKKTNVKKLQFFQKSAGIRAKTSLTLNESRKMFNQIIIPFQRKNGQWACFAISGIMYYDDTINTKSYLYFVEDVTFLYARALSLREKHEDVAFIEDFFKLYRIHSDLTIEESKSLSAMLGYQSPVTNLSDILYCEDLDFINSSINDPRHNIIKLMSASNYPLQFIRLPIPGESDFFIACIWKISTMLKLAKTEVDKKFKRKNKSKDFLYMTLDIKTEVPIEMFSNFADNFSPLEMYSHIKAVLYSVDLSLFEEAWKTIKEGKAKSTSMILRMRIKEGHEWFNFVIIRSSTTNATLYVSSCDTQAKTRLKILYDFKLLETAIVSSKTLMWIFEDADQPERAFSSLPVGTNMLIMNWSTIEKNVTLQYRDSVRSTIKGILNTKSKMDMLIPMFFGKVRWLLFRGSISEDENAHLTGIAIDITSVIEPWEESRKESKIQKYTYETMKLKLANLRKEAKDILQRMNELKQKIAEKEGNENLDEKFSEINEKIINASHNLRGCRGLIEPFKFPI